MRVLQANKFFFRNGGSEAVMFHERDFLLDAGVDVVDFAMRDERNLSSPFADFFVDNQSYETVAGGAPAKIRAAFKLIHSAEAVRKLGRLIESARPDIVHCHNIYHQLTPSIIGAAKRRGVPVVLTLHDYKPVCPTYTRLRNGQVCSACLDGDFSQIVRRRCADGSLGKSALLFAEAVVQRLMRNYEKVDMFIAPSEFMRTSVTQQRFPQERVEVIHNGVQCNTQGTELEDEGYVLYLGRLSKEKGIETLLSAHSGVADRVRLLVAGTGPLEDEMRSRYPRAGFLGHLSGHSLEQALRKASLIVIPSEWYENCPMSVLEAMAFAKPVVASDIGGIPELVVHGETGLLFAPGDREILQGYLLDLMDNPPLRQKYGAAARERAEEYFSLERHNEALLGAYGKVLDRGGSRATRLAFPTN